MRIWIGDYCDAQARIHEDMEDLSQLAKLIKIKNKVEAQISSLIGRPALIGHVGEYIAAHYQVLLLFT